MAHKLHLVLKGTSKLNEAQRSSLMKWIKAGLSEIATSAGRQLVVHLAGEKAPSSGPGSTTAELTFYTDTPPDPKNRCDRRTVILGECGTGDISITAHQEMAVCGNDPKARNQLFLTTDELLGHALANTALHELGHLFGDFVDNGVRGNFMLTGSPPRAEQTNKTNRDFFAGRMSWTDEQKKILIGNIKAGKKPFEDAFTVTPGQ